MFYCRYCEHPMASHARDGYDPTKSPCHFPLTTGPKCKCPNFL